MTKIFWRELKTGELVEEGDFWTIVSEQFYTAGTILPMYELIDEDRWGKPLALIQNSPWKAVRPVMLHRSDSDPRLDNEAERKLDPNL